ncbi:MAG: MBL fold metallo-hydrolase [Anaerolineae bacterium]|nr:MBL fold metallo-hydrolase [Anaerolineae bacterium]
MKITTLGTGTPILDPERPATTAILIEFGSQKVLFDTGRGVTTQLLKREVHPAEIDAVFITHHHYDHICDLGEFLLTAWHNGRQQPINVFGPPGTAAIVEALFNQVYARDILFALFTEPETLDISHLVRVFDATPGLVVHQPQMRVYAQYINHGNSLGLSQTEWPCLAYRLETGEAVICIGGDTVACEGLAQMAKDADVLLLSCYLADQEVKRLGMAALAEHIIASSGQVGKIAAQAGAKRLILTHFRKKSAELMASLLEDVRRDFSGPIDMAVDGLVIEV